MSRLLFWFAALCAVLLLLSPVVRAQSDDSPDVEDEDREVTETVETGSNQLEIRSRSENNEIDVDVSVESGGVEINLHFQTENGEQEAELEFRLRLDSLVEYDSILGLTPAVLSEMDFGDGTWTFGQIQASSGSPRRAMTASWAHDSEATTVDLTFEWSSQMFQVVDDSVGGNIAVPPSGLKWTASIQDFPYTANNGSALALRVELRINTEVDVEEESDDMDGDGIEDDDASSDYSLDSEREEHYSLRSRGRAALQGVFSWARNATATFSDGRVRAVRVRPMPVSSSSGDREVDFLFVANQPTSVSWDPVAAVTGSANSAAGLIASLVLVVSALLLFL